MDPPRLRVYVTCELAILAVLTAVFLLLFPRRPTYLEVGLAILALALLAMNARFTRQAVWGRFPSIGDKPARRRACLLRSGAFTSCVAIAFLAIGLALGHHQGGWRSAWLRVGNWHIALAVLLYFPWALLQQTLFQFYLLGRLRTLLPAWAAVILTGLGYSLVHLPDLPVTAVTALAGVFWTDLYYRYRLLSPLALSHALLGSTFYYWVSGRDLVEAWLPVLGRI